MKGKIYRLLFIVLLLVFNRCSSCRRLPDLSKYEFDLSAEIDNEVLSWKNQSYEQARIKLVITPRNGRTDNNSYKIFGWSLSNGKKGNLQNENGQTITSDNKLRNGENVLLYVPSNTGAHILTVEVADQYGDVKKGLILNPIIVKQKTKHAFDLELQASSRSVFVHKDKVLDLKITALSQDTSDLTYIIKDLEVPRGHLYFENNGEKVKLGSKVNPVSQKIIFKPEVNIGDDSVFSNITLNIIDSQGNENSTSLVLDIKPVDFKVDAWIRAPIEKEKNLMEGDFSVLELMLSNIDVDLLDDDWKLISWKCSDEISRRLVNGSLAELSSFPLKCIETNKLYLKLPSLSKGVSISLALKIEGPNKNIRSCIAKLSITQQSAEAQGIKLLLNNIEQIIKELDDYLNLPFKDQDYKNLKVQIGKVQYWLPKVKEAVENITSNYSVLGGALPNEAEKALDKIINQKIPNLEQKKKQLYKLHRTWHKSINRAFCRKLSKEDIEKYIKHIYEPDQASEGTYLIHWWAESGQETPKALEAAKFIVGKSPDINAKDNDGFTPLNLAIHTLIDNIKEKNFVVESITANEEGKDMEELARIKLLLQCGAKPNIKFPDQKEPLLHALEDILNPRLYISTKEKKYECTSRYKLLCILLEHGANPNVRWPDNKETPLLHAIRDECDIYRRDDNVRKLLAYGAKPDIVMSEGGFARYNTDLKCWTALHAAVENGYVDIIKKLLDYGASRNITAILQNSAGFPLETIPLLIRPHNKKLTREIEHLLLHY